MYLLKGRSSFLLLCVTISPSFLLEHECISNFSDTLIFTKHNSLERAQNLEKEGCSDADAPELPMQFLFESVVWRCPDRGAVLRFFKFHDAQVRIWSPEHLLGVLAQLPVIVYSPLRNCPISWLRNDNIMTPVCHRVTKVPSLGYPAYW